jgi:hypothetical protein
MAFKFFRRIALMFILISSGALVAFGQAGAEIRGALYGEISAREPAAGSVPMSAGEKFRFFLDKSFLSISPYAISLASGALGEYVDNDRGRASGAGDYIADSLTRAARSHAFRTTANFFNKFLYPVTLGQDPRYHRSDKVTVGEKIGYALSRLVITRGNGGGDQFNASLILGGLTAAAISNAWERKERRNLPDSLRRFGIYMGVSAITNIFREFIGGQ